MLVELGRLQPGHGALGPALGYDLALDRVVGRGLLELGALGVDVIVVIVVVPRDRALELADPAAHRAPELRKPLWPEDHEGDDEDDRQLQWSDIRHRSNGTPTPGPGCKTGWRLVLGGALEIQVKSARRGLGLALVLAVRF